ncbi:MAG: hypothetical protein DUD27_04630 [Lachnospiraceae bacterium]|uniref:DMT family transporter n=1 Tax=Candidatus Weimeria bifida TaxID=2599074 RepID=A0A6N7J096_9FIRM|nr:hypothetical protein [Candidatus Weimeria bifida]RRF96398.1 MAG: hypothetical protein DUD27_04630 [Lachnospiraceae bacterium]
MSSGIVSGWIGFFIVALLLAGFVAVFAKISLEGLSAPQTVLIAGITMLVLSFTTLSFNGFFKSAKHFSHGNIIDIIISGVLLSLGCIFLCLAFQVTEVLSTAPFYLLTAVFVYAAQAVLSKKVPGIPGLIVNIMITLGVLLMGFGIHHKHSVWWLFALVGPAFLAAQKLYVNKNPIGDLQQTASMFVVVLVALILSFVIHHKDLKKITAYHVLFAILAGIAFYYAPLALSRANALCSYDLWLNLIYSLWIVITVILATIFLHEKISAVSVTGLIIIVAAYCTRFVLAHFM